jgi:hypothetical protein
VRFYSFEGPDSPFAAGIVNLAVPLERMISATANERVRGLVFVAALNDNEGGDCVGCVLQGKAACEGAAAGAGPGRYIRMPSEGFKNAFAQHVIREQAELLYAFQRTIAVACIQEKSQKPGWKKRPSWFLIAEEDGMISPSTQPCQAKRMEATLRSAKVDHAPIITGPELVVELLL